MFDDPINNFIYLLFAGAGLLGLFVVIFIGLIFYLVFNEERK